MMGRGVSHHSGRKVSLEALSSVTLEVGGSVSSEPLGVYTLTDPGTSSIQIFRWHMKMQMPVFHPRSPNQTRKGGTLEAAFESQSQSETEEYI